MFQSVTDFLFIIQVFAMSSSNNTISAIQVPSPTAPAHFINILIVFLVLATSFILLLLLRKLSQLQSKASATKRLSDASPPSLGIDEHVLLFDCACASGCDVRRGSLPCYCQAVDMPRPGNQHLLLLPASSAASLLLECAIPNSKESLPTYDDYLERNRITAV